MRFSTLILSIAAAISTLTFASPFKEASSAFERAAIIEERGETRGTVVMCTLENWHGACQTLRVSHVYNSCTTLKSEWAFNISSFEPVYGTVCWLHRSTNCSDECRSPSGCSKIVEFPGYANLSTYGYPPWKDNVGSFTCGESTFVPSC